MESKRFFFLAQLKKENHLNQTSITLCSKCSFSRGVSCSFFLPAKKNELFLRTGDFYRWSLHSERIGSMAGAFIMASLLWSILA